MSGLTNLAYLVIGASNLPAWKDFGENIVGFRASDASTDECLKLRMDRHEYRLVIEKGDEEDVKAAGWQIDTLADLEAYVARVRSLQVEVKRDDTLAKVRGVQALYYLVDPNGMRHEFICNPTLEIETKPFVSKVNLGQFITDRFGLGHFVELAKDYEETRDFLERVLGLNLSGYMKPKGTELNIAFFHADTGRFHSIATACLPNVPKLCAHIGLEITDMNDVGRGYDRAIAGGVAELSIGHHPNAKTTSFYCRSPSGFWIELGFGEVIIDDADWHIETHAETSSWGHKPVMAAADAPWDEEVAKQRAAE